MAAAVQVKVAIVVVPSNVPFAGDELLTQDGAVGTDAVVKLVTLALQPVEAPFVFFGTMYQLYDEDAVKPVAL